MSSERTNDENLEDKKLDCQMCEKLEKYKILYQAYADEIRNLWQRSVFLGAFMVLVWTGYGALQLKTLDKEFEFSLSYCLMSIGLCVVIIVLSLLWIAMAKGSKFVQEAYEKHIENLEFDKLASIDLETNQAKRLFCNLNIYEPKLKKENKLSKELFLGGALKAYRYSPSRINIALGYVSYYIATTLSLIHILVALCYADKLFWYYILISVFVAVVITFAMIAFVSCLIECKLKGKNTK